jgi:putative ATP-binding cassette transporter
VRGEDATALAALFRATAGMWESGRGRIRRPPLGEVAFLAERPYLPPGTLRQAVMNGGGTIAENPLRDVAGEIAIDEIVERAGGIDVERDWNDLLSQREQALVSIARVLLARPRFVLLERIGNTLDADEIAGVFRALSARDVAYVTIGDGDQTLDPYDAVLELEDGGRWRWSPIANGRIVEKSESA